jgi:hypothetical protein
MFIEFDLFLEEKKREELLKKEDLVIKKDLLEGKAQTPRLEHEPVLDSNGIIIPVTPIEESIRRLREIKERLKSGGDVS